MLSYRIGSFSIQTKSLVELSICNVPNNVLCTYTNWTLSVTYYELNNSNTYVFNVNTKIVIIFITL